MEELLSDLTKKCPAFSVLPEEVKGSFSCNRLVESYVQYVAVDELYSGKVFC